MSTTAPAVAACPHPEKAKFATERAADLSAVRHQVAAGGRIHRPYRCRCGWVHLTHYGAPVIGRAA